MPTISIITPVYKPEPEYLIAAYQSLKDQVLPAGWQWEWLLQEDGDTRAAETIIGHDTRINYGTGRHNGVAITRNLALAQANGELVKNLDQDDILTPGALRRDIEELTRPHHPEVRWTTSRVLDLLPDGSTTSFSDDPERGRLQPGVVLDYWRTHGYRLPVHPTTICIERELAVLLGGWMSVPGSDDTGLLIAASMMSTGFFIDETGLLYRKWPGQASAQASHTEAVEWKNRMQLIHERATALAALRFPSSVT